MGATQFETLPPLPMVAQEIQAVTTQLAGESYLNEAFTLQNLTQQSRDRTFDIVHLATHSAFVAGHQDSYIQLWGGEKLQSEQLRTLQWHAAPQVELLVLSACETALGDAQAELGFAGLAVQAGVKSVLASLWSVSDLGTLVLMREFYRQVQNPAIMIKSQALQQAQLSLLRGDLQNFIPDTFPNHGSAMRDVDFTHPYYWSSFTLVGSPW